MKPLQLETFRVNVAVQENVLHSSVQQILPNGGIFTSFSGTPVFQPMFIFHFDTTL